MFTCRACTRTALSAVLDQNLAGTDMYRAALAATTAISSRQRISSSSHGFATAPPLLSSTPALRPRPVEKDGQSLEWVVRQQLDHLQDPLHIAHQVQNVLAKDHFEEAALLVRKAGQKYRVTVSWNHLIDHQLRQDKVRGALKLYSEMKKRAQPPNAQTYTIIFRGLAHSSNKKLAVAEAQRVYHNMLHGQGPTALKPNTLHLNALLDVCAKALDVDSMFTVLDTANEGLRAPNNQTYTIVLNALRVSACKPRLPGDQVAPEVQDAALQQVIDRAKGIWADVIKSWRDARIRIDEELVCAMGRILLLGPRGDIGAVLDLIEQTMQIPKDKTQMERLLAGKPALKSSDKKVKEASEEALKGASEESSEQTPEDMVEHTLAAATARSPAYAQPGRNSLSLILRALHETGKTTLAPSYWDIFTKLHHVAPDSDNWYSLLRVFHRGRASANTATYLRQMPQEHLIPKTFRTAFVTCLRDNLNTNAFLNATCVFDKMLTSLRVPDMHSMRLYLRIAYANHAAFNVSDEKDLPLAKLAWGRQLTVALENIWEPYTMAAKQFSFGGLARQPSNRPLSAGEERTEWLRQAEPRAELAALARKMIAAYDRLIGENMVTADVVDKLKQKRNPMNRFVMKYFEERERFEPGWNERVKGKEREMDGEVGEEDELEGAWREEALMKGKKEMGKRQGKAKRKGMSRQGRVQAQWAGSSKLVGDAAGKWERQRLAGKDAVGADLVFRDA